MIKTCSKHGEHLHSILKGGRVKCRKCMYEAVKRRRYKVKAMAVEYKGGECEACGYNRCSKALEFHHKDPSQKDFTLASSTHNKAWEVVRLELDKCVMLCANCHREEHERLCLED